MLKDNLKILEEFNDDINDLCEEIIELRARRKESYEICDKIIREIKRERNKEVFGENFDYDNGFNDGLTEIENKINQLILKEL